MGRKIGRRKNGVMNALLFTCALQSGPGINSVLTEKAHSGFDCFQGFCVFYFFFLISIPVNLHIYGQYEV